MLVEQAIAAHKAAVLADEADFTDDGIALDEIAADASGTDEAVAFSRFIDAPCVFASDVQAKIGYILAPAVGNREANINRLTGGDGEHWTSDTGPEFLVAFMRSLVVTP